MLDSDRESFAVVMATCDAIYSFKNIETLIEVFWRMLKPYQMESVKNAFNQYISTGTKAPTPADILKILNGGSAEEQALMAWPKVCHLLELYLNDSKTLIPDGAAALAARDMYAGFKKDEYKYNYQSFKQFYIKYYNEGYRNVPTTFEGIRYFDDQERKYLKQSKFVLSVFWTPEEVAKHRKALIEFSPKSCLLKAPISQPPAIVNNKEGDKNE